MVKERITDKEAKCLLITFIIGSSIILGLGVSAKNDAWLAGITGLILSIPFVLIYIRIINLYQGKDLFEIVQAVFGKVIGKIFCVFYTFYCFHLGSLVFRNFGEFVNTTAMTETPLIIIILLFSFICLAAVRSGIEVIARFSTYILPFVLALFILMELLSIPIIRFNLIKPVMGTGISVILKTGFSVFSFPFAETVIFTGVFYTLRSRKSTAKVYFSGIVFGALILVIHTMTNSMILGNVVDDFYFPTHAAASRIQIGNFIQRVEGSIAISFLITAFIKGSICLFVACKGISSIFNLEHYKYIVIQVALLMAWFSVIVYDNIVEMQIWAFEIYQWYALPFQVVFPLIIWITAEIRKKVRR